jgi:hypothetical protein
MNCYSPLIDPPTNVQQYSFGTTSATVGPISPGMKLMASDTAVQLAFGNQTAVASNSKFYFNGRPEFFQVGSAAPYLAGAAVTGTSVVSFYDVGGVWSCEPPRPPVHVVTLYDADYYYELGIDTATEILLTTDVDTTIAFADTFVKLFTANYFPIKSKVMYRWRLNTAHRFVHFSFATASIASDREFTAVRRFEGFTAARKKALRALPKRL